MKILHIITGLDAGGAEISLQNLLTEMNRQEFEPSVISLTDVGKIGDRIRELNIPVYALDMRAGLPLVKAMMRLRRLVKTIRPDLIQGWMYHGNLAAWLVRKTSFIDAPIIWGVHHVYSRNDKFMTRLVIRFCAAVSKRIESTIYVARGGATSHEALGYRSPALVIPNGFDLEKFQPSEEARLSVRQELGLTENTRLIGALGRYHPVKDQANLLKAARLVLDKHSDVHIVLAGRNVDQENRALRKIMDEYCLNANVHLLGERSDAQRLMAAFEVYVSSSFSEAFPLVLGEAMACGTLCVATDVGDSAHILGGLCRVVPPKDACGLAEAIVSVLELSPQEVAEKKRQCRARMLNCFSMPTFVDQYAQVYRRFVG